MIVLLACVNKKFTHYHNALLVHGGSNYTCCWSQLTCAYFEFTCSGPSFRLVHFHVMQPMLSPRLDGYLIAGCCTKPSDAIPQPPNCDSSSQRVKRSATMVQPHNISEDVLNLTLTMLADARGTHDQVSARSELFKQHLNDLETRLTNEHGQPQELHSELQESIERPFDHLIKACIEDMRTSMDGAGTLEVDEVTMCENGLVESGEQLEEIMSDFLSKSEELANTMQVLNDKLTTLLHDLNDINVITSAAGNITHDMNNSDIFLDSGIECGLLSNINIFDTSFVIGAFATFYIIAFMLYSAFRLLSEQQTRSFGLVWLVMVGIYCLVCYVSL